MSEYINNSEFRKKKLQELIKSLHEGKNFDDVKEEFDRYFGSVTTQEITQIEQTLIKEGLPVEEIQRLCDVHAAVFKGSIADIHGMQKQELRDIPGHPINVFVEENHALEEFLSDEVVPSLEDFVTNQNDESKNLLLEKLHKLSEIDIHYARKENLFFPYLEKHGITAPPKVMWGVDDEIRAELKEVISLIKDTPNLVEEIVTKANAVIEKIREMIYKENDILLPLLEETLTFYEWIKIDKSTPEMGYFLVKPKQLWGQKEESKEVKEVEPEPKLNPVDGELQFETGRLSHEEINAIFNTLPFDITFVDANNKVKYFSQTEERIFKRPKTVIGREVTLCHPPSSLHVVEKIVDNFRYGKKDHEDFWIDMKGTKVFIRYYAVRNSKGEYLGTMEVTQNITDIQKLEGEKRLMDDEE
ncbi:TPA: DUF438 domain-containing protein [bacterium]|jgi:DUF438 domain-containing protein|nr:DUF438 domain-containing protein [bacterium]